MRDKILNDGDLDQVNDSLVLMSIQLVYSTQYHIPDSAYMYITLELDFQR